MLASYHHRTAPSFSRALCRQRAFAKELAAWIKASAFSEVVLLSSVEAGLRGDQQLQSTPVCAACHHSPAAESALASVPAAPTGDLGDKSTEERCVAPWYVLCTGHCTFWVLGVCTYPSTMVAGFVLMCDLSRQAARHVQAAPGRH